MKRIFQQLLPASLLLALADERHLITVVAHVDVIPPYLDQALPILERFATNSRADPGVEAFTLITWAPTTNHFQIIEIYDSMEAFRRHVVAPHTIAFRSAIQPFIGAPYDERRYEAADRAADQ